MLGPWGSAQSRLVQLQQCHACAPGHTSLFEPMAAMTVLKSCRHTAYKSASIHPCKPHRMQGCSKHGTGCRQQL
jgi:hypothetical protein